MAVDSNGPAKPSALASLCNLLPPETLQQWINMDPLPSQLAQDAAMCEEAKHWLAFATAFEESKDWKSKLQCLNTHLLKKSVVFGSGMAISPVDIAVFLAVRHRVVSDVIPSSQDEYRNVVRWFDYIQGEDKVASAFQTVPIRKSQFEPQDYSDAKRLSKLDQKVASSESTLPTESVSEIKEDTKRLSKLDKKVASSESTLPTESVSEIKEDTKQQQLLNTKKAVKLAETKSPDTSSKVADRKEQEVKAGDTSREEKRGKKDKTAAPKNEEKKADDDTSVSALDIRVGLIIKVWKHPSADALFVEEIDLGESSVRQVVSGLARYLKEEDLLNRKVVLIANVKPGKLRDVVSAGLVLCASNPDHSSVEPLIVPDEAAVGERITFAGHEGKPEDVLNPKKKQLEKIFPDLYTDDNGIATYKGIPFMTSAGPCNSTLPKAPIK
ncbi:hypothetical protein GOP47_0016452 [Adiantum capillus-veneris]|uniref:tRNA-binding domain-containing protein n=1 Tax=Adiantum capillus-veneris TaxID=13818 RepID=A0A9D4ZBR6_ADICA|nr:hypothetical protein GOP47_0016452 [Adiantum capillus-veneris]